MKDTINLNIGTRFDIKGITYEISYIERGNIRCSNIAGGKIINFPLKKFEELCQTNVIKNLTSPETEGIQPCDLSKPEIDVMNYRLKYVRTILKLAKYPRSINYVLPLIKEISEELEDESPPSFSNFARWMGKYIQSDQDPMSLVSMVANRGNRTSRLGVEIEKIIYRRIEEDYLTIQKQSAKIVYKNIQAEILEEYANGNSLPTGICFPSERTINRRINKIDPYRISRNRDGKYIANKKFKAAGQSLTSTRILETVEADGNILDVMVVDENTGEVMGRPYGTCLIDQYSRCVIAFVITMIPFSAATLLKTLKIALSGNGERFGGLFEILIVDNGSDYISDSVKNFCNNVGIRIEYGAPRDPNTKPHVERFFGRLNTQLIHTLPGTTFSNPNQKADYDAEKHACLSLDELKIKVSQWLDLFYHKELHQGHGRAPEKLWNENLNEIPVITYPIATLDTIARDVIIRTISKGRITAYNLKWYSHALATVEAEFRMKGTSPVVHVYIDTLDLANVFIKNPKNGKIIEANSVVPKYTNGMSLYEHENIRKNLNEKGKKDISTSDQNQLIIDRWKFRKDIVKSGKKFARKQIARLREHQKTPSKVEQAKQEEQLSEAFETERLQSDFIESNDSEAIESFECERF